MEKTIFISSFNPFILRNILLGDVLSTLKKDDKVKIVIFVPDYKVDFFKKEIGAPNIIIEGIKTLPISRRDIIFRFITSSLINTSTVFVHKRVQLEYDGRTLRFLVSWLLMKIFSRFSIFKELIRCLDYAFIEKKYFKPRIDFSSC